jgi:hypothetical protein
MPAVKRWGVYANDFIGVVQGRPARQRHVNRTLIHALDRVF